MIFSSSVLRVADNSGGKYAKVIRVIKKGAGQQVGKLGDLTLVSIKKLRNKNRLFSKVKKGDMVYGVIAKIKKIIRRSYGLDIRFYENAIVLLNKQTTPVGTRLFLPIARELRMKKFIKLLTLSLGNF